MQLAGTCSSRAPMKIAKNPSWQTLVGNRVVMLREAKGVRQGQLAKLIGISPQRLSNYERGERPLDIELAILICDRLAGTLDYLYRGNHAGLAFEIIRRLAAEEGRLADLGGNDDLKN